MVVGREEILAHCFFSFLPFPSFLPSFLSFTMTSRRVGMGRPITVGQNQQQAMLLPRINSGTSLAGKMSSKSRKANAHFRSNQIVRDHVLNFTDTTLHMTALKEKRKKQKKGKPVHEKIGNEIMKETSKDNVEVRTVRAYRYTCTLHSRVPYRRRWMAR